jgi:hypothetical protein
MIFLELNLYMQIIKYKTNDLYERTEFNYTNAIPMLY